MKKLAFLFASLLPVLGFAQFQDPVTFDTPIGPVEILPIYHASLMITYDGKIIHVDPYSSVADYPDYPKADLVLITHEHGDHYDRHALAYITTDDTHTIATRIVADDYNKVNEVLANGDKTEWNGIGIEAVAAYNIENVKEDGTPYHPKGDGNGYLLRFGDFRVYIAADTELTPEMREIGPVDVAFLPVMLPYTMSDEQFYEAARAVNPKVLFPYHYQKINKRTVRENLPGMTVK